MASAADNIERIGEKLGEKVDKVEQGARQAASRSSSEFRNLMADVEDLLGRVTHINDEDIARVRARVEASLGKARDSVSDGTRQVRERATQAATAADDYAHDSPWTLVAVAAVAGLALGAALSRR